MRRKSIAFGGIMGLLLLAGLWVAVNVVVQKQPKWQNDALTQELIHGKWFALQKFFDKQAPDTPQHEWRRWQRALKQGNQDTAPVLLFVENVDNASFSDYHSLFSWVAQGNHAVMPLPQNLDLLNDEPAHESDGDETETETGADAEHRPLDAATYHWLLMEYLGILVHKAKEDAGARNDEQIVSACRQAQQQRLQAAQAAGIRNIISRAEKQEHLDWCQAHLNLIKLPEGPLLTWYNADTEALQPSGGEAPLWQGQGASGSHIVRVGYGKGSIVLLTSIDAFNSPKNPYEDTTSLNLYDHAYLAAYLAEGKSALWFVRQLGSLPSLNAAPAWWRLWQGEPLLMLALVLMLAAVVWRLSMRVGPLRLLPLPQERYLAEHIGAQGRFLMRQDSRAAQLRWLQQQLHQHWQQQWPQWPSMDEAARVQAVCRRHRVPPSVAHRWLQTLPDKPTLMQWLAYIRAHQSLLRRQAPTQSDS